jgi:hypothetical protein
LAEIRAFLVKNVSSQLYIIWSAFYEHFIIYLPGAEVAKAAQHFHIALYYVPIFGLHIYIEYYVQGL